MLFYSLSIAAALQVTAVTDLPDTALEAGTPGAAQNASPSCPAPGCGALHLAQAAGGGTDAPFQIDPALREEVVGLVADTIGLPKAMAGDYLHAPRTLPGTGPGDTPAGADARHAEVYALLDDDGHVLPLSVLEDTDAETRTDVFDPCAPLSPVPRGTQAARHLKVSVLSPEQAELTLVQVDLFDIRTNLIERSVIGRANGSGPASRAAAMAQAWEELGPVVRPPRDRQPQTVNVDPPAAPETCRVRMTVSPEDFTMTHTPDGDFTEYNHPGPGTTYIGTDRMAMLDPGGRGWVEFPGYMGEMMRGGPEEAGPMDLFDPGEVDESLYMARMPRYLVEALGWQRMLSNRARLGMEDDAAFDLDTPCPDAQSGCASLRVRLQDGADSVTYSGTILYDARRRVVRLPLDDGRVIAFSYGDLDMGRPPGW
jgi:hypothetical protein